MSLAAPATRLPGDRGECLRIIVRVCSDCNGWMNQKLEIPARKTLEALHHSNSIVLRADDQALLAAYMTKHMLMINLWSKAPTDPTFDTRMYRRFRVTMKPPAYTRIWVGVIKDADTEREQQITGVLPETRDLGDGVKLMFPRGSSCHIGCVFVTVGDLRRYLDESVFIWSA